MEALHIESTDSSPEIILDQMGNRFEISGKSLPEDVILFYQPVLDWLEEYRKHPKPFTRFYFKFSYFNTASSKIILDIMLFLEELKEDGHGVLIKWISQASDEDMQEAGREYQKIIDLPFEHATYE